jgi:hypothetical protein
VALGCSFVVLGLCCEDYWCCAKLENRGSSSTEFKCGCSPGKEGVNSSLKAILLEWTGQKCELTIQM